MSRIGLLEPDHYDLLKTATSFLGQTADRLEQTRDQLATLNQNIETFTKSQDSLSEKIYWLNVILALATAGGTFVALVSLAKNW